MMESRPQLLLAIFIGISSHVLYFHHGEHHLYVVRYIQLFLASWLVGTVLYHSFQVSSASSETSSWLMALVETTAIHFTYLFGVFTSLFTYRLFLNPLNRLPGPFSARISTLSRSWQVRDGKMFKHIHDLHNRYGPIVRVAPYEISVTHPEAVTLVQGHGSRCFKGPNYDLGWPLVSIHSTRDHSRHAQRRRVWSQGFSDKAVRGYETRIRKYQDKLIAGLAETRGQPTDFTLWMKLYSFDIMGDLAFGKSFSMLDTGQNHPVIDVVYGAVNLLSRTPPIWVFRLGNSIPVLNRTWLQWVDFARDSLLNRIKSPPDIPDIMSALLAPVRDKDLTEEDMNDLVGDSQLIIIAGGDTTLITLTAILYLLARNPVHLDKLRAEITPVIVNNEPPNGDKLMGLNHLNGVINEALRLYPPVPSNIVRLAPPQGITIGGTYIPGGTSIWVPQFSLGRDESLYPDPDEFIPERWYEKSRIMARDKPPFAPFSIGPYNCIGKPFALANIRTTIARLITTFDISFPAPLDPNTNEEPGRSFEEGMLDHIILGVGELELCLVPRSESALALCCGRIISMEPSTSKNITLENV